MLAYLFKLHLESLNAKLDAGEAAIEVDPVAIEIAAK